MNLDDRYNLFKLEERNVTDTHYFEELDLFISRLAGEIDKKEVLKWQKSLKKSLHEDAKKAKFRLLIDLRGFDPKNEEVHEMWLKALMGSREIEKQCIKIAFVHHDSKKMFEMLAHKDDEKSFFDDIDDAFSWFKKEVNV
jgi:hypothetical protein